MVIRRWHYPYREGRDLSLERHRSNVGRERGMRGGKEQEKVRLNYNATFLCNFKLYVQSRGREESGEDAPRK